MHGSTIQVVGVELVNAFTARRCLLCVVNVDLSMPFHDLSDSSSQVLQQSHEGIDFLHILITLLDHNYLLNNQCTIILDQFIIVYRNTTCLFSISSIEFMKSRCYEFMLSDVVMSSVT